MPKRKRKNVDQAGSDGTLGGEKGNTKEDLSVHTLGSLKEVHDHLGPGTRVEFIQMDFQKTFPTDQKGFPCCAPNQVRKS